MPEKSVEAYDLMVEVPIEATPAKAAVSLQSGWTELLGFLKAHCEAKKG